MRPSFAQGPHCTAIQHNLNVIEDASEQLAICDEYDQEYCERGVRNGVLSGKYTVDNYESLLSAEDFRRRMIQLFLLSSANSLKFGTF